MIQDVGNVELFELYETDPETQCKECLSYWSEGIVNCTCGHLSIPEYNIEQGRPHGHRYGKTPEKKEYHLAHNLKKRCIKRKFTGMHDRFFRDLDLLNPCSNIIEMKMFVVNGVNLQNKITHVECQNQNT